MQTGLRPPATPARTGLQAPAPVAPKPIGPAPSEPETAAPAPRRRPRGRWRAPALLLAYFAPTIAVGAYLYGFATDRYVSESAFVVRSASKPTGVSGIGALLQMTGIAHNSDIYSVNEFLASRDAVSQLQTRLPLAKIYGDPAADLLSRYPSPLFGGTQEELFKYFVHMSDVSYNTQTGVTTLRVQAFRPEDAKAVNSTLLDLSEQLINRLNERVREDTVRAYEAQVAAEQKRLVDDQVAIVAFQNKELTIDPKTNTLAVSALVGRLGADLAQTQTRIAATSSSAPDNPALPALRGEAAATQSQIAIERARIGDSSDALADKLAAFTRLDMDRTFAVTALAAANTALDNAKVEAQRQQLYLDRIVEPNQADYATRPQRAWLTTTAFLLNLLALMMLWLIRAGMREHGNVRD